MRYLIKNGLGYYWNQKDAWVSNMQRASRYSSAGEALRMLADEVDSHGAPFDYDCEINIQRESD